MIQNPNLKVSFFSNLIITVLHPVSTMSLLTIVTLLALSAYTLGCVPCACDGDMMYCAGLQLMKVPDPPSPTLKIKILSLQVLFALVTFSYNRKN